MRLHLDACPRAPGQMLLPTSTPQGAAPPRYRRTLASSVQGSWALVEPSPVILLSALSKKKTTNPKITLAHFSSGFPRSQGSKYKFSRFLGCCSL